MDRDNIVLILVFSLFLTILVLSTLYVDQITRLPKVVLDNQTIDNMTKEEIVGFYTERENMLENNKGFEILTIIIGVLGFTLGVGTTYLISKRPTINIDLDSLLLLTPKYERDIIKILVEKKGEATQHYIRTRLGINKVTMTRLVEKMESEGTIEVTRGRVNYIRLSEKLIKTFKNLGFNFWNWSFSNLNI